MHYDHQNSAFEGEVVATVERSPDRTNGSMAKTWLWPGRGDLTIVADRQSRPEKCLMVDGDTTAIGDTVASGHSNSDPNQD